MLQEDFIQKEEVTARALRFACGASALVVVGVVACATATRQSPSGDLQTISPGAQATVDGERSGYTAADVRFMSGMIRHHAQAVLMSEWAPTHRASRAIRTLSERILVSQQDEIAFMQRWLQQRGESAPVAGPAHAAMIDDTDHPMLMPGMLTAEQLTQLDRARGPEFDRLFLTFMIQHHEGAITMVEELFRSPGAAQEEDVFRFASDVHADQIAEIDRMNRMLATMSNGGK